MSSQATGCPTKHDSFECLLPNMLLKFKTFCSLFRFKNIFSLNLFYFEIIFITKDQHNLCFIILFFIKQQN